MIPVKPILKFLLFSVLAYAILMGISSYANLEPVYAKAFVWGAKQTKSTFRGNGKIVYQNKKEGESQGEVRMILMDQDQIDKATAEATARAAATGEGARVVPQMAAYKIDTWVYGFLPTVFVLALIIAGPVSWLRKLLALPLGLILITLFLWLKLDLEMLYLYNIESSAMLNVAPLSAGGAAWISRLHSIFFSISFNMIVAIFIWVLVTFRKDDLQKILKSVQASEKQS